MDKPAKYQHVISESTSFLSHYMPPVNLVGRMSIIASSLKMAFPDWIFVGFYQVTTMEEREVLEIGPYQGNLLACGRIEFGDGICGMSASRRETVIIDDVSASIEYISCDDQTKSEIVVPVFSGEKLIAVLDIDSGDLANFDEVDKTWLEKVAEFDHLFKIVLVGDSAVGKSSLLVRFADDKFSESYISTIGVDFRFKSCMIDGKRVKYQIWDTAGQERFRTITSAYYRGADGAIIVFDKANRETFDHISHWIEELNKFSDDTTKVIVGNKSDLQEEITKDQGYEFANQLGINYIETSALTAYQVSSAFEMIGRALINKSKEFKHEKGNKLFFTKKKSCCQKM